MLRALTRALAMSLLLVRSVVAAGTAVDLPRTASVTDGIQMEELASPSIAAGESPCSAQAGGEATVASFSRDGRAFVVTLRRGNVKSNTIDYTMVLWGADDLEHARPRVILNMSSSSLRPAIDPETISWAQDGRSLMFLGERAAHHHELFGLDLETGKLRVLAQTRGGDLINYSRDVSGSSLAYEVGSPSEGSLWNNDTARHGLAVTSQSLSDVEAGTASAHAWPRAGLFVQSERGIRQIDPPKGSFFPYSSDESQSDRGISMSPNGRYVVVLATVPIGELPRAWHRYRDPAVQWTFRYFQSLERMGRYHAGEQSFDQGDLERYVIVDLQSGRTRILLDSPVTWLWADPVVWAPDSRRVVLSDVLTPIGAAAPQENSSDLYQRRTLAVDLATGTVRQVDARCQVAVRWAGNLLTCSQEPSGIKKDIALLDNAYLLAHGGEASKCGVPKPVNLRLIDGKWSADHGPASPAIAVFVREGLNVPTRLYYQVGNDRAKLLLDPNPQLARVRLAKESLVTWEWSKRHSITGGLYTPPTYRAGQRYPLVIQTHVFTRDEFSYFGGYPTANAAQPLAARGIFVLQMNDTDMGFFTPQSSKQWQLQEVRRAIQIYKSAIAFLSNKGLIDPRRVGIIGFSHTCFFVDWAITHDPGLFAAASVTEGGDGSYLEYMIDEGSSVEVSSLYDGPPFGGHLRSWFARSPIFNIDHVRTPLWIGVDHHSLAYTEWEWFGGLKHLGKPVYMVVLDGRTNDGHLLVTPWNRLISSGENVDWFDFWLNDHQSRDPSEAARYAQWRRLRALYQGQSHAQVTSWESVE